MTVRVASQNNVWEFILFQRAQWHSLLSTKYQRMKPELKLMLSLEDDTQTAKPSAADQEHVQHVEESKLIY